ncbi:MAG: hypothetical protein QW727_01905 [Candidatus Pacearchaeota archaeon]
MRLIVLIIISLILVGFVIFLTFGSFFINFKNEDKKANQNEIVDNLPEVNQEELSEFERILNQAKLKDDVEECNALSKFKLVNCKSEFYYLKFQEEKNFSYCKNIEVLDLREKCVNWDGIKLNEALNSEDIKICDEIINSEVREDCKRVLTKHELPLPLGEGYG